jgi:hypothetical protein
VCLCGMMRDDDMMGLWDFKQRARARGRERERERGILGNWEHVLSTLVCIVNGNVRSRITSRLVSRYVDDGLLTRLLLSYLSHSMLWYLQT